LYEMDIVREERFLKLQCDLVERAIKEVNYDDHQEFIILWIEKFALRIRDFYDECREKGLLK